MEEAGLKDADRGGPFWSSYLRYCCIGTCLCPFSWLQSVMVACSLLHVSHLDRGPRASSTLGHTYSDFVIV